MVTRGKPSPDQLPMFTPHSDWVLPNELPDLSNEVEVALDTETRDMSLSDGYGPGAYKKAGHVCGISAAWRNHAIYIPLHHNETQCFDKPVVGSWLKSLARQDHTRFIFHNFQYDWSWLEAEFNIPPPALLDDVAAMSSMIDENLTDFSLDGLCLWQGLQGKDETLLKDAAAAYVRGIKAREIKKELWRLPGKYVGPYAEQDAISTLKLAEKLRPILTEENLDYAYGIERELMPITLKMKQRGIRVDVDKAKRLADDIFKHSDEILGDISRKLGQQITIKEIRSSRVLQSIFEDLGLKYPRTRPSAMYEDGQASFEKEFMMNHEHWFPPMAQKVKHMYDLADKFLKTFICEYAHKGRVHPTVNQFRSETGGARSHRVSYTDPPLQQMPSRDDTYAPLIRSCFQPEDGELWAAADVNQQEYRLIVHTAEESNTRYAGRAGNRYREDPSTDFHQMVVDMTGLIRRRAKDVNFAKAFGAGVPKFAAMIGVSEEEAKEIYETYDKELPFVNQTAEMYSRQASMNGYIKMIDGARGHFNLWEPRYRDFAREDEYKKLYPGVVTTPCHEAEARRRAADPHHPWGHEKYRRAFTHKAFNRMIQGSAARQTKKAMVDIYKSGYVPLLQMHDELDFSFANEKDGQAVREYMINAVKLRVPVMVDLEWGVTWGRAAKNKNDGYNATYNEAMKELKYISSPPFTSRQEYAT